MSDADEARYGRVCFLVLNVCPFTLRHVINDYYIRHGSLSLQDFLEKHKHDLYHLWKKKCCCRSRQSKDTAINRSQWDRLYIRNTSTCGTGHGGDCPCQYDARPGVTTDVMDVTLCCLVITRLCHGINISHIDTIREVRNNVIHAERASLDQSTFYSYWNRVQTAVIDLANRVSHALRADTFKMVKDLEGRVMNYEELKEMRNFIVEQERMKEKLSEIDEKLPKLEEDSEETHLKLTDLQGSVDQTAENVIQIQDSVNLTTEKVTHIEDNLNQTTEKVEHMEDNLNQTTEKVTHMDDNLNQTTEKVEHMEDNVNQRLENVEKLLQCKETDAELHECSLDKDVSELLLDAKREYVGTELLLCRDSEGNAVIIGYNSTMSLSKIEIPGKYRGKLRIKNPRNVSDEAFKASTYGLENKIRLNDWEEDILQSCIARHSSRLWGEHSNLTMISGDCVKYTAGLPEVKFCVVLYCLSKGYIPFDEQPFPKVLNEKGHDIEVDVREGYFLFGPTDLIGRMNQWNDPVCMGSSIGNKKDQKNGSVGFFVNLPNNGIGFITCCHVLFDCIHSRGMDNSYGAPDRTRPDHDAFFIVQPSLNSFCGIDKDQRICGFVERAVFKPECDPVSVDAALVRMTDRKPGTGHFTISMNTQISEAGYDEKKPPLFNGGKILCKITSNEREKPLIKSGTRTGLTKGEFKMNGLEVSIPEDGAFLGDSALYYPKRVMKGQYEVRSSMTFFDLGDSGSAVFLKDPDGSLKCVGMAIGRTSFYTTVVTPIGAILQALGLQEQDMTNFGEPMNLG